LLRRTFGSQHSGKHTDGSPGATFRGSHQ